VQRSNTEPTNLQSVKVASKNEHPVNVQFRNAAWVCRERLNRQSRKVHSAKTAPSSVASVRSTPTNATRVCS
jgi:hypothetical protein